MNATEVYLMFLGPMLALGFGIIFVVVTGWADAKPKDKPSAPGDR